MTNMRRTELDIDYEGANISQDIAPFLTQFSFTDNGAGKADDLKITLADRENKWRSPWMPKAGDKIKAAIIPANWTVPGSRQKLPCGWFEVDSVSLSGPPNTVSFSASSLPTTSGIKNEERTRAWEKTTLKLIASSIAKAAGLKLLYEVADVKYDRIDQTQQSDLSFLAQLADKEGAMIKIANGTLVFFDDTKLEKQKPVRTITYGESDIKSYSFDLSVIGAAYSECQLTYTDSVKKRTFKGTFKVPGVPKGPVLKINERVESTAEAIRYARNAVRAKNREAQRATIRLVGDIGLVQGVTVDLARFGKFDGRYIVESATHTVNNGGYETTINVRKVLNY